MNGWMLFLLYLAGQILHLLDTSFQLTGAWGVVVHLIFVTLDEKQPRDSPFLLFVIGIKRRWRRQLQDAFFIIIRDKNETLARTQDSSTYSYVRSSKSKAARKCKAIRDGSTDQKEPSVSVCLSVCPCTKDNKG